MSWEEYWSGLLDKKKLKSKVDEMNQADKILKNEQNIEEICHNIYDDYDEWKKKLEEIRRAFLEVFDNFDEVHLQCSRIKTLDSLLVKVITKRYENLTNHKSDYSRINGGNYKSIITDLIGLRLIINYRGKWTSIHNEILEAFPYDNSDKYEYGKELLPHPIDGRNIQVEIPKAYYAEGDDVSEYDAYKLDAKRHKMGYRSIHYTVSFRGVYIEIQLRTIYDEAWSDCDHSYVYKQDENKSHTALVQMSEMLCKLTNLSNDIGEGMKDIFENESMLEVSGNRWNTSKEVLNLFDNSLARVEEVYRELNAFRSKLVNEELIGGSYEIKSE